LKEGSGRMSGEAWEVSDELWARIQPLLPHRPEVVPRFVDLEVAVPRLSPAVW
jgi:hypothetical protein